MRIFLLFIFLCFTFYLLYEKMPADVNKTYYFNVIGDSMFFALPVLFCKMRRFVYSYLLLIVFYLLSIVAYYHTYCTIMPLSSYLLVDNLKGLGPSIKHSIYFSDLNLIVLIGYINMLLCKMYLRKIGICTAFCRTITSKVKSCFFKYCH